MTETEGAPEKLTADERLADDLSRFYSDPLGYVMYCFPWDSEPSIQMVILQSPYKERFPGCKWGPDVWACEFLDQLGDEIKKRGFDGRTAVEPIQFSTVSGHGIGKSAMAAWLLKFILDTRPGSIGTVTAMTAEQLRHKTWAQVGKWHKMSLTSHWFDYTTGRGSMGLFANRLDRNGESMREQWKCTAQTCREENSEAFAGQHAPSATSFYIFDEASGIAEKIFEVREGGLTDGEPMTFDWGNPTRPSGRFFEQCEGRFSKYMIVRQIDSRDVAITNKKLYERWIETYGVDSDYVKVRVRGMFPAHGSEQFISGSQVQEAMERELVIERGAALTIGVDVARYGDDEAVIYPVLGYDARSFAPVPGDGRYRGLDTNQLVDKVIQKVWFFRNLGMEVAAIFVDATGSAGVADNLRHLGYFVVEVLFGNTATDAKIYRYVSDEIWGRVKEAMPKLILPGEDHPSGIDLRRQLTQREFGYTVKGNKIHLETKKDMKERLGGDAASPDIADALACNFKLKVAPKSLQGMAGNQQQVVSEYDPLRYGPDKSEERKHSLPGDRYLVPLQHID